MFSFDRKPKPCAAHSSASRLASPRLVEESPQGLDARHAARAAGQGGTPIPREVLDFFEPRFGHDFSRVRVHADRESADAANAVRARAYTVGRDIVFGPGEYAPTTSEGRRLLAHELAHVIQQEGSSPATRLTAARQYIPGPGGTSPGAAAHAGPAVGRPTAGARFAASTTTAAGLQVSSPGDTAEREAEAAAEAVIAGRAPHLMLRSSSPAVYRLAKVLPRDAKEFVRKHGRGELDLFLDKIITDGTYRQVMSKVIKGVEHIWEVRAADVPGQEWNATYAGLMGEDKELSEDNGKRKRHRRTFVLRSGVSSNETVLHELIHLRISIDKELPEAERSSFYGEYAQMMEIATDEAGLGLLTGVPARKHEVLAAIEQLRQFFIELVDPNAEAKLRGAADVQPDVLIEFVVQEKYVGQTSSATFYRVPLNNDTIARRYAGSIASRFREHCDEKQASSRLNNPIGKAKHDELVLKLSKALVAFFDQIDQQKKAIEDFKRNPPARPGNMPDPQIFETRPLQIGGAPAPLSAGLSGE